MNFSRKVSTIVATKPSHPSVKPQPPKLSLRSVSANQEPSNKLHKANQQWGSNVKDPRTWDQRKLRKQIENETSRNKKNKPLISLQSPKWTDPKLA